MRSLLLGIFCFCYLATTPWGFYAHKEINYLACFTLPTEMFGYYKANIEIIKEWAVKADQRRYAIESEAPKHYIDLDHYEQSVPIDTMPRDWDSAVTKYSEQTLLEYGILPWNLQRKLYQLTKAFKTQNYTQILKLSADIGHYVGDAHVPLHTTENYNGQLTDQVGIHGLWESRLPEVFASGYDFFSGEAEYLTDPLNSVWEAIAGSFAARDSVLRIEKELSAEMASTKYAFETRGATTVKVYSKAFSEAYHIRLNHMVERRMQKAIQMVGSCWYTCWVNAGQPELVFDINQKIDLQSQIDSLDVLMLNSPIKGRMESH